MGAGVREAQGRNRQFATVNPAGKIPAIGNRQFATVNPAGKIPAIARRLAVADDPAP